MNHQEPLIETTIPTIALSVKVDAGIIEDFLPQIEEQRIVIVHCQYPNKIGKRTHLCKTTYLIDKSSGTKSKLLHAENIVFAPAWMPIQEGTTLKFTLFFSGLPKTCITFDLIEDCTEAGRFYVLNIQRKTDDVYNVIIETTPISFWH
ncbi:MAG: hypothetical protein NTW10_05430 [Bacteroidetes bacterium]|nr:hypothetical protein [Bacteroidota bacterium]